MLLSLLKEEYLPELDTLREDQDFASFVSILGEMLSLGDHAVSTAPLLLERFAEWPHISSRQADALREMARAVSLRELPFDAVTHGLIVTGPGKAASNAPSQAHWPRRDWTWLLARGRLHRTCLGGENVEDAKLFALLGRVFAARKRPHALQAGAEVSLRLRGFGGSTAGPEMREEVLGETPLLCILDSDRDHPHAPPGDTAKRALKTQRDLTTEGIDHLVHVELIAARDIENLLPRRVVEAVADTSCAWYVPMLERGFFVDEDPRPELRYIDIGKDQCERRLLDAPDPATRQYRIQALTTIRSIAPTSPGGAQSPQREPCPRTCGAAAGPSRWADMQEDCKLVRSVGKQLLPNVVAYIQAQDAPGKPGSVRWLDARIPNDPALLEPAALVWSWGISLPRRVRSASNPL